MIHRGSAVPRLIALQGTKEPDGVEPLYRHPADEQPPLTHWTPTVDSIRQEVERNPKNCHYHMVRCLVDR